MTIKTFVFDTHQYCQTHIAAPFKRTHIYELLATAFGYNSFAVLNSQSILLPGDQVHSCIQQSKSLHKRCLDLGYPTAVADFIATQFPILIEQKRINILLLSDLILKLRQQLSYRGYSDWQEEDIDESEDENLEQWVDKDWPPFHDEPQDLISQELLKTLEDAATRGNASAHYALALIHSPVDADERSPGFDYWYNQEKSGRVLTGVEKEWAEQYAFTVAKDQKYEHHLREAGRLGNALALIDLADFFDDPTFFEQSRSGLDHDPLKVAEIAEKLDRYQDVHSWLTVAAENGETEAMLRLIEEFDQGNLQRCWTWIYLAELLGTDLTKDNFYAIHEDGSDYDDDVGVPMYVDGREGVRLESLGQEDDVKARKKAQELFEAIQ